MGAAVQHYYVVEIDDGIKPAFFYKTEHGYELLFSFDAKTAKKNIREEIEDRKSTRLNSSHSDRSRMPSSA